MEKKILPAFVEVIKDNEVTLHALNTRNTGSKKLHLFSADDGKYNIGDRFVSSGDVYIIKKITKGSAYFAVR